MTMLEKAARAAQEIQVGVGEDGKAVFPGPHVGLALARAVLMAVREPDDAVKKKLAFGDYTTFSYGGEDSFYFLGEDNVAEFARDLIDAILDGK